MTRTGDEPSVRPGSPADGFDDFESGSESWLPRVPRWTYTTLSALAGAAVAVAVFSSMADLLNSVPFLVGGVVIAFLLWRQSAFSPTVAFLGFLLGLNVGAVTLLVDPPCENLEDVFVKFERGVAEVGCWQYADVTGTVIATFVGSAVLLGLLVALRKLRAGDDQVPADDLAAEEGSP